MANKFIISSKVPFLSDEETYIHTVLCRSCYEAEITNDPLRDDESVAETDAPVACEHCPRSVERT